MDERGRVSGNAADRPCGLLQPVKAETVRKGETSGHRQRVREIRVDCDRDTILLRVEQVGAACHEGYASCFFRRVDGGDASLQVVDERLVDPKSVYR